MITYPETTLKKKYHGTYLELYKNMCQKFVGINSVEELKQRKKEIWRELRSGLSDKSSSNKHLLISFFALQNAYERSLYQIKCNAKITPELDKVYNEILDKMVDLAHKLGLNNSIEYSLLFAQLLWPGSLSATGEHKYNMYDDRFEDSKMAYSVLFGTGVCRHYADMLTDFLNRFSDEGIFSAFLTNSVMDSSWLDEDVKGVKRFKVVRNVKNDIRASTNIFHSILTSISDFLVDLFIMGGSGHAFNLIMDNGEAYIYDATNLATLVLKTRDSAGLIGTISSTAYIFPLSALVYNLDERSEKLLESFCKGTDFKPLQLEKYNASVEKCISIFKSENGKRLIEDFQREVGIIFEENNIRDYMPSKKRK